METARVSLLAIAVTAGALTLPWYIGQSLAQTRSVSSDNQVRMERFRRKGLMQAEAPAALHAGGGQPSPTFGVAEAPTGFDNRTNGFSLQGRHSIP